MDNNSVNADNVPKETVAETLPPSHDVTRTTLQILFIAVLIGAVGWVMRPFISSIVWAGMIVVTTWPVLLRLQGRLRNKRWLAVMIMTVALLLVVVIPVLLAITAIIMGADDGFAWLKSLSTLPAPPPPGWLGGVPLAGPKLVDLWKQLSHTGPEQAFTYLAPYARETIKWFIARAGSVGMVVLQFFLTVIIAAIFYARGETASLGIRNFARRLAGRHGVEVMYLAEKAIRGVALGVVVTALMQATIGGIGLLVTGVPAVAILTAVMFMLCLAQAGPTLVLIPALIWVYANDGVLWGTILLVFAVLAVTLDNIIRPVLIRKGADMPLVMIFAGVIGGLLAFGIIGLFIGPVVLAVAYTLLKAWVGGSAGEETAVNEESGEG